MKKHIQHHWGKFRSMSRVTQYGWMILVTLLLVWIVINTASPATSKLKAESHGEEQALSLPTQTVGSETEAFATVASWSGEVISPNDADVQPPRAGAIIAWDVAIGERVYQGQVLGRLSATPLTPELAKTLADQTEAVTRARSVASSTGAYSVRTRSQLGTFANSDTIQKSIDQAKSVANANSENVRSALHQAIAREFSQFAYYGDDAFGLHKQNRIYAVNLKQNFGVLNSALRDQYIRSLDSALRALDGQNIPDVDGREYFLSATRLVSASIGDENYSQDKMDTLKRNIGEDQAVFNDAVEKYRTALLDVSQREKELAERARDTQNSFSTLDREQVNAEADLIASEAAYRAVTGAINGGAVITAPKSGVVSAIVKQVGEYVEPGITVASISSGNQMDKMVRFRIPSNAEVPKKGGVVRIVRPGFAKEIRSATIIGVGTGLDGNGAFMADARFNDSVLWPTHLSVRVIPEIRLGKNVAVPFDAVWWDEENHSHIWAVKEDGTISSRLVTTGRTYGDAVEILSGLAVGDTYVTQPTEHLKEGMRLQVAANPSAASPKEKGGDGHAHGE